MSYAYMKFACVLKLLGIDPGALGLQSTVYALRHWEFAASGRFDL